MRTSTRGRHAVKHALAGLAAAASISIAIAAQAPPAAVVTTNNPEVDRHVAAAKAAAGSDWEGLYTAVCGDAVGFAQPAAPRGGGAGRGAGGGGVRRGGGGGAPAGRPRASCHAEPVKVV